MYPCQRNYAATCTCDYCVAHRERLAEEATDER